ncbi:MAG: hypothetical protein VX526_03230, partial [Actinomycetota bacterium]|nr:hypothetical protein [Actinomycetota bacterium]
MFLNLVGPLLQAFLELRWLVIPTGHGLALREQVRVTLVRLVLVLVTNTADVARGVTHVGEQRLQTFINILRRWFRRLANATVHLVNDHLRGH